MILPEPTQRRLPQIKAGLLEGKTSEQIADECGVTRLTIERDKQKWRQSGELEDWIREEAIRLHYIVVKKKPTEAYREIMRLLGKTLTRKMELKEEIAIRERVDVNILLAELEATVEKAANRTLNRNHPKKPVDTTQTYAETS